MWNSEYDPLRRYLEGCGRDTLRLTFGEIEAILGRALPPTARRRAQWWSNISGEKKSRHTHAYAWYYAGYRTKALDLTGEAVTFYRAGAPAAPRQAVSRPPQAGEHKNSASPPAALPERKAAGQPDTEAAELTLCGFPFRWVARLIPDCDSEGNVLTRAPQGDYHAAGSTPLNRHGDGVFCRFRISAPARPGVYLWLAGGALLYIGETDNLQKRFNMGYGSIQAVNCYARGQSTNCKMNKVAMEYFEKGLPVSIYFYETRDYKNVERQLLAQVQTKYNAKK